MTKNRLRSLSYSELTKIAEQGHISVFNNIDKESLVNIVFDALEEERQDREELNNLAIQIETKKYTVSQDEELFLGFGEEVELPDRYHENALVLMLRDPSWVFAYWDLEDRIYNAITTHVEFGGFILRVNELASSDWGKDSVVDWFDIPVQFNDLRRYINLPSEDSHYGIELFALVGEKEELIIRSNIVESSRDYISHHRKDDDAARVDLLIELSGLSTDIGDFPGSSAQKRNIPQRVMEIADLETAGDNREN